jgi:hypothetical protein
LRSKAFSAYAIPPELADLRSTAEDLKHEKYLYGATAGPYQLSKYPHALLANWPRSGFSTARRVAGSIERRTRAETRDP